MAENPIAYALSGLGQTFRDMTAAEAARRRDALAGQVEENQQRRALALLQMQGERQVAEFGLKGSEQEANIRKGEQQLGFEGRRTATEEQRTRDIAAYQTGQLGIASRQVATAEKAQESTAAYQTGQLQHLAAQTELATLVERNQQVLREAQIRTATAQQAAAESARLSEDQKTLALTRANEEAKALSDTKVNLHGLMQSLVGGPRATAADKNFLAAVLGNGEQQGIFSATSELPYGAAQTIAKGLIDLRNAAEKNDAALTRELIPRIVAEGVKNGMKQADLAESIDFVSKYVMDPAGTVADLHAHQALVEQLRPALYAKRGITDPSKMPLKQKTEIDAELNSTVRQLRSQGVTDITQLPTGKAPPPPPLPALQGLRNPVVPSPATQESPQIVQTLQVELARKFVGGKIPDGPHFLTMPGLEPGRTERFAVRVTNGKVVDFLLVSPAKATP